MKQKLLSNCLVYILLLFLKGTELNAQGLRLIYDKKVGCRVSSEDKKNPEFPGVFLEEIDSDICLMACEWSDINYSINDPQSLISSTNWSVTGGVINNSDAHSASITWGTSGNGTFVLSITKTDGTILDYTFCITVVSSPNADFIVLGVESPNLQVCQNNPVFFVNTSMATGGKQIMNYFWDFGDGNYSSEQNPEHTYSSAGTYPVTLTVTNECYCESTIRYIVEVLPSEHVEIECRTVSCSGAIDKYWTNSKCKVEWEVTNGIIFSQDYSTNSIQVKWDNDIPEGYGTISAYSDCFTCPKWKTVKIPLVSTIGKIVGDSIFCRETQEKYSLPQWPSTDYTWTLSPDYNRPENVIVNSDQRNEAFVSIGIPGNYVLRCDYKNTITGCTGFAEIKLRVLEYATLAGKSVLCEGERSEYIVNSPIPTTSYTWTIRNNNDEYIVQTGGNSYIFEPTQPGIWTLAVGGTDFCSSASLTVNVYNIPSISEISISGADRICFNQPYEYSILASDIPPGFEAEWTVTNGTINGTTRGSTVVVQFSENATHPVYEVQLRFRMPGNSTCNSEPLTYTVQPLNPFAATIFNTEGSTYDFCPSTYATLKVVNLPVEYEDISWSVYPPQLGSIAQGQYTDSVKISWNEIQNGENTGEIHMSVRLCGKYYTLIQPVSLKKTPVFSWNNPSEYVCGSSPFSLSLMSDIALSQVSISWQYDGQTTHNTGSGTTFVSPSLIINNYTNSIMTYPVSVIINSPDLCEPIHVSTDIMVYPAPMINITPGFREYFCNQSDINTTLNATFQQNLTISTIQWYKQGTSTPLASGSNFTVTPAHGFGIYYAEAVSSQGCSIRSNRVEIVQYCPPDPIECTTCANPPMTGATLTDCNTVRLTSSDCGLPGSGWVYDSQRLNILQQNGCTVTLNALRPGKYRFGYNYFYTSECSVIINTADLIVPYAAHLRYDLLCNSNGTYTITLYNNSENYLTPDLVSFVVNGAVIGQNTVSAQTVVNAGETYTLQLTLNKAGYPSCTDEITIIPDSIPDTAFSIDEGDYCPENALLLTPAAGLVPGWNYEWKVQGSGMEPLSFSNRMPEVLVMPGVAGMYSVRLRVTNSAGCTAMSNPVSFRVLDNEIDGRITGAGDACEGDSKVLTYQLNPNSLSTVSAYQWMRGNTAIAGATGSSYAVTQTGSYWLRLWTQNGCVYSGTLPANVLMLPLPKASVSAPTIVCEGDLATLKGRIDGAGQYTEYRWTRGNTPLTGWLQAANTAGLTRSETIYATQSFTLETKDTKTGCKDSYTINVSVAPRPRVPVPEYRISGNNPYTVDVFVINSEPDINYLWSNSMQGDAITVLSGGAYRVRAVNASGCVSEAQIDVPRNPEEYIWIFPSGCVEKCFGEEITLLGPSPTVVFNYYDWLMNNMPSLSGQNNYVPEYNVPDHDAFYNLSLTVADNYGNSIKTVSDPLSVILVKCESCDELKTEIFLLDEIMDPYHYYVINLWFNNFGTTDLTILLTEATGAGVIIPAGAAIPAGSSGILSFIFIPNGNFTGQLSLTLKATAEPDFQCIKSIGYNLPLKPQMTIAKSVESDTTQSWAAENYSAAETISFSVSPNPVEKDFLVRYSGLEQQQSTQLIVYNLSGKSMWKSNVLSESEGVFNIDAHAWTTGHYVMVLARDGNILKQEIIIKN